MAEFVGSAASQADFIWKNAKTCGDFKHTDFGKIILPFTLLRRLECALESTREASLDSQPATIEFLEAEFSVDFDALLS